METWQTPCFYWAHDPLTFRQTEDIFQALEDNQVQLSTMKASRFVKAFEKEVDHWERTLSHIMETVSHSLFLCLRHTPGSNTS